MPESYIQSELVKALPYQQDSWRLYHWRDRRGDLLAESGRAMVAIEAKASATVNEHDLQNLRWFISGDGLNPLYASMSPGCPELPEAGEQGRAAGPPQDPPQ